MSKEGLIEHTEFLKGYFQRQHVQEFLKKQNETRQVRFGNIPVVGRVILGLGEVSDYIKMFAEAEEHATYKGYKFQ